MTPAQAKARHNELSDEIRRHDHAYYVAAKPIISDREYDRLYKELIELETHFPEPAPPDSPSERVGRQPLGKFETSQHLAPMMSLDNTYSQAEVRQSVFSRRIMGARCCEVSNLPKGWPPTRWLGE